MILSTKNGRQDLPGILFALFFMLCFCSCKESIGQGDSKEAEMPAAPREILVRTEKVQVSTQEEIRSYSGYTHPWNSHGVGFLVGGRVTSLPVTEGEKVRKGQLLATLDPTDYRLTGELAQIQVDALQPNVERIGQLVQERILPPSELDEFEGKLKAAMTQKEQARRQSDLHTRVFSPIAGTVYEKRTSVGQVIGPGMSAVVILDLSKVRAEFGVTQQDLVHFNPGDEVIVRIAGDPGKTHRIGKVHHVRLVPDSKTRTYAVNVQVDNDDDHLRPGMFIRMEVATAKDTGIFLPLYSVGRNSSRNSMIYVVDEATNKVQEKKVTLGRLYGERIKILAGLQEGDLAIVEGQEFVVTGDKVRIR